MGGGVRWSRRRLLSSALATSLMSAVCDGDGGERDGEEREGQKRERERGGGKAGVL